MNPVYPLSTSAREAVLALRSQLQGQSRETLALRLCIEPDKLRELDDGDLGFGLDTDRVEQICAFIAGDSDARHTTIGNCKTVNLARMVFEYMKKSCEIRGYSPIDALAARHGEILSGEPSSYRGPGAPISWKVRPAKSRMDQFLGAIKEMQVPSDIGSDLLTWLFGVDSMACVSNTSLIVPDPFPRHQATNQPSAQTPGDNTSTRHRAVNAPDLVRKHLMATVSKPPALLSTHFHEPYISFFEKVSAAFLVRFKRSRQALYDDLWPGLLEISRAYDGIKTTLGEEDFDCIGLSSHMHTLRIALSTCCDALESLNAADCPTHFAFDSRLAAQVHDMLQTCQSLIDSNGEGRAEARKELVARMSSGHCEIWEQSLALGRRQGGKIISKLEVSRQHPPAPRLRDYVKAIVHDIELGMPVTGTSVQATSKAPTKRQRKRGAGTTSHVYEKQKIDTSKGAHLGAASTDSLTDNAKDDSLAIRNCHNESELLPLANNQKQTGRSCSPEQETMAPDLLAMTITAPPSSSSNASVNMSSAVAATPTGSTQTLAAPFDCREPFASLMGSARQNGRIILDETERRYKVKNEFLKSSSYLDHWPRLLGYLQLDAKESQEAQPSEESLVLVRPLAQLLLAMAKNPFDPVPRLDGSIRQIAVVPLIQYHRLGDCEIEPDHLSFQAGWQVWYIRSIDWENGEEAIEALEAVAAINPHLVLTCATWVRELRKRSDVRSPVSLKYAGTTNATGPMQRLSRDMNHAEETLWTRLVRELQKALTFRDQSVLISVHELSVTVQCGHIDARARPDIQAVERAMISCLRPHCLNVAPGGSRHQPARSSHFRHEPINKLPLPLRLFFADPSYTPTAEDSRRNETTRELVRRHFTDLCIQRTRDLVKSINPHVLETAIKSASDAIMHYKGQIIFCTLAAESTKESRISDAAGCDYNGRNAGNGPSLSHINRFHAIGRNDEQEFERIQNEDKLGLLTGNFVNVFSLTDIHKHLGIEILALYRYLGILKPLIVRTESAQTAEIFLGGAWGGLFSPESKVDAQLHQYKRDYFDNYVSPPDLNATLDLLSPTARKKQWELRHPKIRILEYIGKIELVNFGDGSDDCALAFPSPHPGYAGYNPYCFEKVNQLLSLSHRYAALGEKLAVQKLDRDGPPAAGARRMWLDILRSEIIEAAKAEGLAQALQVTKADLHVYTQYFGSHYGTKEWPIERRNTVLDSYISRIRMQGEPGSILRNAQLERYVCWSDAQNGKDSAGHGLSIYGLTGVAKAHFADWFLDLPRDTAFIDQALARSSTLWDGQPELRQLHRADWSKFVYEIADLGGRLSFSGEQSAIQILLKLAIQSSWECLDHNHRLRVIKCRLCGSSSAGSSQIRHACLDIAAAKSMDDSHDEHESKISISGQYTTSPKYVELDTVVFAFDLFRHNEAVDLNNITELAAQQGIGPVNVTALVQQARSAGLFPGLFDGIEDIPELIVWVDLDASDDWKLTNGIAKLISARREATPVDSQTSFERHPCNLSCVGHEVRWIVKSMSYASPHRSEPLVHVKCHNVGARCQWTSWRREKKYEQIQHRCSENGCSGTGLQADRNLQIRSFGQLPASWQLHLWAWHRNPLSRLWYQQGKTQAEGKLPAEIFDWIAQENYSPDRENTEPILGPGKARLSEDHRAPPRSRPSEKGKRTLSAKVRKAGGTGQVRVCGEEWSSHGHDQTKRQRVS